jgi:hypothetical protein
MASSVVIVQLPTACVTVTPVSLICGESPITKCQGRHTIPVRLQLTLFVTTGVSLDTILATENRSLNSIRSRFGFKKDRPAAERLLSTIALMLSLLLPFLIALLTFWSARGRTEPESHATINLLRANLDNRIQINSNLDRPRAAVTAVKNVVMGPLSVKLLQSTGATFETSTNANTTTSDPSYRGGAMGGGAVAGLVICLVFVFLMGGFCYRRYRASGAAQRGGAKAT